MPYNAAEMYRLVEDIDAYAEFLPWCRHSAVIRRAGNVVDATLDLQKGAISKTFTTQNTLDVDERISLALLGGPFSHLAGAWTFQSLGPEGSRVSLALEFEFESRVVDLMFGAFFEETCNSLVDAFTRRAAEIYGDR